MCPNNLNSEFCLFFEKKEEIFHFKNNKIPSKLFLQGNGWKFFKNRFAMLQAISNVKMYFNL